MQIALNNYKKLLFQIQKAIKQTEENVVKIVDREKVVMSWKIGQEIEEYLKKNSDASYGKRLFEQLVQDTAISEKTLYKMCAFYKTYPTLPSEKKSLSWSHYRSLVSVPDKTKRAFLEDLTVKNNLSSDQLQREIARENSPERKKARRRKNKEISAARNFTKLKITRGQLFTYKIVKEEKRSFVDLGFNIFTKIKTALPNQTIVESRKSGEKILLKKSAVKPVQMYSYKARLDRVVDGDTIHVTLDLGFKITHKEILRLTKINAPEFKTLEGKKSSDALKNILKDVPFLIVKTNKTDIYGRYLADVFFSENKNETNLQKVADSGIYLSQLLLDKGLVEKY